MARHHLTVESCQTEQYLHDSRLDLGDFAGTGYPVQGWLYEKITQPERQGKSLVGIIMR